MTHYDQYYWPPPHGTSSHVSDGTGGGADDHDMHDIEEGGAPLVEPSSALHHIMAHSTTSHPPAMAETAIPIPADHETVNPPALGATSSLSPGHGPPAPGHGAPGHAPLLITLPPPVPPPPYQYPHMMLPSQAMAEIQAASASIPEQTLNPLHVQFQGQVPQGLAQMLIQLANEDDDEFADLHPPATSNPNPLSLAPDNLSFVDFLRFWAESGRGRAPATPRVLAQFRPAGSAPMQVRYEQLRGDKCDLQGIDWEYLGVSRRLARERRKSTYRNYTNKTGSDVWHSRLPDQSRGSYYRFRNMHIRRDVRLLHFQLRNVLGCASRSSAFFPSLGSVKEIDPTTGRTRKALDFESEGDVQVSTLAATEDLLMVGCFNGDYRFRSLHSESLTYTEGRLTDNVSGITNHVQIYPSRRSSGPQAAFASNDWWFRLVDLTTNTIVSETMYDYALNCSAVSPDKRLRVMVGDDTNVLIADAESGEVLQKLEGHRDWGFACDWSSDGWTVATGFQDKSVRIWDARMWRSRHTGEATPVTVLRMEMSGARSLRFSPLGSGKPLLVAAEESDFVNIFDAETFGAKQKIDVFGEIGGVSFADNGQSLMTLITDGARGGLMQLDRCGIDRNDAHGLYLNERSRHKWSRRRSAGFDWTGQPDIRRYPQDSAAQRYRKATTLGNLDPF